MSAGRKIEAFGKTIEKASSVKANNFSNKIHNAFVDAYNSNVNNMMASAHGYTKDRYEEYKSEDYTRLAFQTRAEITTFQEEMASKGIDITTAPTKVNGQFIAEINNKAPVSSIISDFQNKYGNDAIQKVNYYEKKETDEEGPTYRDAFGQLMYSPYELANGAFHKILGADANNELLSGYNTMKDIYKTVTNPIHGLADKITNNSITRYGATFIVDNTAAAFTKEAANGHLNQTAYKSAMVLNGDTVLIDGKLVTGQTRDHILKEYNNRIEAAQKIASGGSTAKVSSPVQGTFVGESEEKIEKIFGNDEARKTAQEILRTNYKQEIIVENDEYLKSKAAWSDNGLDKILTEVNTGLNVNNLTKSMILDLDTTHLTKNELEILSNTSVGEKIAKTKGNVKLSFEERKEIVSAIRTIDTSAFTLNDFQFDLISKLAQSKNIPKTFLNYNSTDKAVLRATLKRYLNNSKDTAQKAVISNFLKNGDKWILANNNLERINTLLNNPNLNLSEEKREKLQRERDKLIKEISSYKINEKDLHKVFDDISAIDSLKKKIEFNKVVELKQLASKDISRKLEKDFADLKIDFTKELSKKDLVEINKEAIDKLAKANIQVVKRGGNVDLKLLQQLTPLQLANAGLSKETIGLLIRINSKNEFGNNEIIKGLGKELVGIGVDLKKGFNNVRYSKATTSIASKIKEDEDIAELASNYEKLKKGKMVAEKAVKYSYGGLKVIAKDVVRETQNAKIIADNFRAKQAAKYGKEFKPSSEKATERLKKRQANQKPKPINEKRNEKFKKEQEKKLEKLERKESFQKRIERSKFGKATRGVSKFAKKASDIINAPRLLINKAKGFAVKILAAFLLLFLKLCGIAMGFIVLLTFITSFSDKLHGARIEKYNSEAPETFKESAAYRIYEQLKFDEDYWLSQLGDYNTLWSQRNNLKYGEDYVSFQNYESTAVGLYVPDDTDVSGTIGDEVYINPFYTRSGGKVTFSNDSTAYMTKVEEFDGVNSVDVGTNDNKYSRTEGQTQGGYISNIETGHTSNIKDIIAMTDIMYSANMDAFNDINNALVGEDSVLGTSPAQIDYVSDHSKHSFADWICSLPQRALGIETESWDTITASDDEDSSQCYSTILAYANGLFNASHQESFYLDINYYKPVFERDENGKIPTDSSGKAQTVPLKIGSGSEETEITSQVAASHLGCCINPTVNKFKLEYLPEDDVLESGVVRAKRGIHVYGEGITGTRFETDINSFPVNISYDNIVDKNDSCLHYSKDVTNSTTGETVKRFYELQGGMHSDSAYLSAKKVIDSPCWKRIEYEIASGYRDDLSKELKSTWCDSEDEAENNAKEKLKDFYNNTVLSYVYDDKYELLDGRKTSSRNGRAPCISFKDDKTQMTMNYSKILDESDLEFETTKVDSRKGDVDEYELHLYLNLNDDETYAELDYWDVDADVVSSAVDDDAKAALFFDWIEDTLCMDDFNAEWYDYDFYYGKPQEIVTDAGGGTYCAYIYWSPKSYKTEYQAKVKMTYTKEFADVYERDCQGHDFAYCGGHLGIHSHGIVYSMTNEQIKLVGVQDKTKTTIADNFDDIKDSYGKLKGKVDRTTLNREAGTFSAYKNSGYPSSISEDIYQGSYVSKWGLNLYGDSKWAPLTEGADFSRFDDEDVKTSLRDIFDVDSTILYGSNIFPCSGEFEKYKGWTDDNMTLAIARTSADWNDMYGFDIPLEIGNDIVHGVNKDSSNGVTGDMASTHLFNLPLSKNDINKIDKALKENYSDYTEGSARQKAVKRALNYVGRGHAETYMGEDRYKVVMADVEIEVPIPGSGHLTHKVVKQMIVDYEKLETSHDEHGYLAEYEESTEDYAATCISGNEDSFINYLRKKVHEDSDSPIKIREYKTKISTLSGSRLNSDYSNAQPGDYLASTKEASFKDTPVGTSEEGETLYDVETLSYYKHTHAAVFIGVINDDITLSSGQILHKDTPIIVDMAKLGMYTYHTPGTTPSDYGSIDFFPNDVLLEIGGIYIHGSETSQPWLRKNKTVYEWVTDPDKYETIVVPYDR